ncbi:CRAL-TRIO domain-containing protein [Meloidogyne graminicola]|uniref:CRAL-TRIO domain-containing protein n=1 Tax=Meloidogyne graminicola TaxID=189291 RepID=A0A8S9ZF89_9BILA|nr:CRAL-TRIO domain-containing protein [Meloidogyne graminicola]
MFILLHIEVEDLSNFFSKLDIKLKRGKNAILLVWKFWHSLIILKCRLTACSYLFFHDCTYLISYKYMKNHKITEVLRQKVKQLLRHEELTEINLLRWLKSYNFDVDLCAGVIEEYVKNRNCLGLNDDKFYEDFYNQPEIKHYYNVFKQSRLEYDWINALDNGLVFVEMCPKSASTTAQLIRTGQFLFAFFAWSEYMLRMILQRERETSQRSYAVCIFDMDDAGIWQFANPNGPINRLFESRVKLATAYYEELLSKVVIMNPPRMLGLLFSIISWLLPRRIIGRFHFVNNAEEASKYISIDAIPIELGGKKVFDVSGSSNGSIIPGKLPNMNVLQNGGIWEKYNINNVQYENVFVHSKQSFTRELCVEKNKRLLLYEFHASRAFRIKLTNEKGDYLLPYLYMNTTVLSEEGEVKIKLEDGRINLEIRNESILFAMKLRIAYKFIE